MYENSISRRYSQCWWAAEVVSDHYTAYIESIYLNRMKMCCEMPHLCNTTRHAASLTGLLHTRFSQKRRSISKRRFGQPFSLLNRWNTFFAFQLYIKFLQKANCITEHAGSSHHRNWMYVITFIFKLFFTKVLLKFASDAFYIGPIWTRQTPIFINNLSIISYGSRVHQFEPHPWHSMHGLILSSILFTYIHIHAQF